MQRRIIAYEQSEGIVTEQKSGIVDIKLPDNYGDREVIISVRRAVELNYVDRFVDLGRMPEGQKLSGISMGDLVQKAMQLLSSELAD
jgi:hypothetical protein